MDLNKLTVQVIFDEAGEKRIIFNFYKEWNPRQKCGGRGVTNGYLRFVGDPDFVVESAQRRRAAHRRLLLHLLPRQKLLAQLGQDEEDKATPGNEPDHKDPVLPSHWDDTESCDLKNERRL